MSIRPIATPGWQSAGFFPFVGIGAGRKFDSYSVKSWGFVSWMMLPINWQSFKLTCEVNCCVWHDAFQLGWLCFWPEEVFLLLVSESQGRRGFGTVNAKLGSWSWHCFWPWEEKNPSFGISNFVVCCEERNPVSVQGAGSLWSPWSQALLWPVPSLSLMLWLPEFGDYVRSSLFLPPPPLPLRPHWLSQEDCIILTTD